MADNWQSINLNNFFPPAIANGLNSLTDIIDRFLDIYKESIAVAEAYEQNLSGGGGDILGTLVQALTDIVEGFLQAGKVHVLFVPIPKIFPTQQTPNAAPTLDLVAQELGFSFQQAEIAFASGTNTSYTSLLAQSGGNGAFFRTFATSLNDVLDVNRPQYNSPGDAVAMSVLMVGAPSFTALIDVATAFNRLFRPQANMNLLSRVIPVPQNLRASVIGLPKATKMGVQLAWDAPKPIYDSPYFPAVTTTVKKYAVIRSTDPKVAASAKSVLDFFSTDQLTVGLTSDDKAKASQVIAIGTGSNASYVDSSELDPSKTYFYCVAWQVQVTENGKTQLLKYDQTSNVVKTFVRVPQPGAAQPPNWTAYGSMIDLVPDLSVMVETMLAQIQALASRQTGGASGSITAALDLLQKNIDQFIQRLDDLNAQAKRLNAIVSAPLPGLFSTSIVGVGGNAFLVGELANRLGDTSDPNRPPYDDTEYVMGLCLVAGGPRLPDIQPIIAFIESLFGPSNPPNTLNTLLNTIGQVVTTQEKTWGPNMAAYPINPDGTVQIPAGTVLPDGSVVPAGGIAVGPTTIDPKTGLPKVTPGVTVSASGAPVQALDPANPYTGDP